MLLMRYSTVVITAYSLNTIVIFLRALNIVLDTLLGTGNAARKRNIRKICGTWILRGREAFLVRKQGALDPSKLAMQ